MDLKAKNTSINISITGLFCFNITSTVPLEVEEDAKGEIIAVKLEDNYYIRRFKAIKFTVGNSKLIIKPRYIIANSTRTEFEIRQDTSNVSTIFILPLIMNPFNIKRVRNKILNAYAYMDKPGEEIENIYLVLRMSGDSNIVSFQHDVQFFRNCVGVFDIDRQHFCAQFTIPEKFTEDVDLIRKGKYSKISKDAKDQILNYYVQSGVIKGEIENHFIFGTLYKTQFRRNILEEKLSNVTSRIHISKDAELYDLFDPIKETYLTNFMAIQDEDNDDFEEAGQNSHESEGKGEKTPI